VPYALGPQLVHDVAGRRLAPTVASLPDGTADMVMSAAHSDPEIRADVDDAEVYVPLTIGMDEIPVRDYPTVS
jgi:hypothetical protein